MGIDTFSIAVGVLISLVLGLMLKIPKDDMILTAIATAAGIGAICFILNKTLGVA